MADVRTTSGVYPSIWAKFELSDVLKGKPASRVPGFIDVLLTSSDAWEYAVDTVPNEEVILFLMNEADYKARFGQETADPEADKYVYWRTNPQAVLRNVGGEVDVIDRDVIGMDYGRNHYPMTIVGDDFEQTIDAIRRAAAAN